jgi:AcrR family transcriptional regulator
MSVAAPMIDLGPRVLPGAGEADPRARRILEAAYQLLDEGGLEGLTIRAVLTQTGLARRAFYDNFDSKDDLVVAVFEQTIRMAADTIREQSARMIGPEEKLRFVVMSIALGAAGLSWTPEGMPEPLIAATSSNRRSAALAREHLRLAESRPRELQAALAPLIAFLAEQLREGMAAGHFRQGNAQVMATLIYNLLATTMHTALLTEEVGRPDRAMRQHAAEDIWEFCRRAVMAE